MTYRAAVIGLGRMGSTFDDEIEQGAKPFNPNCHAPSYAAHERVELVAGADPHSEQREIFAARWGLSTQHVYADHRQMLAVEKPDIVSICTTARVRHGIILDTAAAGVGAIWAEKPLSLTLAEADDIVSTCAEHNVTVAVNCARRWTPAFAETRRRIDSGEFGNVLQVTAYANCGLSHNGSHAIDIIRYLAGGEVTWVFGEMESDVAAAGEGDLMGNGYLAFDNGVRAYLRSTPTGQASWEIDVIGTEQRVRSLAGGLDWELWRTVPGGPRGGGVPARIPFPLPARIRGMGLSVIDELIAGIETGARVRCSDADGLAALEVAIALRESHRRGGVRVDLPLTDRSLGIHSSEIREDDVPARVRRQRAARG
ncbi:MAG: Gfo/Idh/MocA family oxidoreductase [bacterium]|nr:Gfo/Idh/MocA family oxidoreductase [bacterium]